MKEFCQIVQPVVLPVVMTMTPFFPFLPPLILTQVLLIVHLTLNPAAVPLVAVAPAVLGILVLRILDRVVGIDEQSSDNHPCGPF